jgi:hypothetical protein
MALKMLFRRFYIPVSGLCSNPSTSSEVSFARNVQPPEDILTGTTRIFDRVRKGRYVNIARNRQGLMEPSQHPGSC